MKLRFISALCTLVLLVTIVGSTQASAATGDNYFITTVGCNIRSGPDLSYGVATTASKGTHLRDYTDRVTANIWYYSTSAWGHVYKWATSGYVRFDLVCPLNRAYTVATSSTLHLRDDRSLSGNIIGNLQNDTIVARLDNITYIADGIEWVYVVVMTGTYENKTGYVAKAYLASFL